MERKYTMIPKKYIKDSIDIDSNELFLLIILLQNITNKDTTMFTIRYLCNRLEVTTRNTNRTNYIINTLKHFQDKEILFFSNTYNCIEEIEDIKKYCTENKIDVIFAELYYKVTEESFIMVYDSEFDCIIDYCKEHKLNKYYITHVFLYILACIKYDEQSEDHKICYPSIKTIANEIDLSETTIIKYLKALQSMKLIYYNQTGYKIENGQYKTTKTYYSRYEDKHCVEDIIDNEKNKHSIKPLDKTSKSKTNTKRSLKQKINRLSNKINKSEEEVKKLEQLKIEYEKL